jgi:hypothetical protein
MIVDILFFEGCPNHAPARELVKCILSDHGSTAEIRDVEVIDAADALAKKFLGSPTIRVDGVDVDPSAAELVTYGMMCRVYRQKDLLSGVPPREMIERALEHAQARRSKNAHG